MEASAKDTLFKDPIIKAFKFWSWRSLPRGRKPNAADAAAFYVKTRLEKPEYLQGRRWQEIYRRLRDAKLVTETPTH